MYVCIFSFQGTVMWSKTSTSNSYMLPTCANHCFIIYWWKHCFFQEFQLSITIPFFVSILVVFILYGIILSKFYKIRKRVETFQKDLTTDVQQKEMKTEIAPKKFQVNSNVIQNSKSEEEKAHYNPYKNLIRKKSPNILKQVSFHFSYIKSSNYVLTILFIFWLLHSPIFIFQTVELSRSVTWSKTKQPQDKTSQILHFLHQFFYQCFYPIPWKRFCLFKWSICF